MTTHYGHYEISNLGNIRKKKKKTGYSYVGHTNTNGRKRFQLGENYYYVDEVVPIYFPNQEVIPKKDEWELFKDTVKVIYDFTFDFENFEIDNGNEVERSKLSEALRKVNSRHEYTRNRISFLENRLAQLEQEFKESKGISIENNQ